MDPDPLATINLQIVSFVLQLARNCKFNFVQTCFILRKVSTIFFNLFQVKVPHVCQLAHKLAYLVGESIHQRPKAMEELLYYL